MRLQVIVVAEGVLRVEMKDRSVAAPLAYRHELRAIFDPIRTETFRVDGDLLERLLPGRPVLNCGAARPACGFALWKFPNRA